MDVSFLLLGSNADDQVVNSKCLLILAINVNDMKNT